MAEVVLVHGIGELDEGSGDAMADRWVESIAAGSPPLIADGLRSRTAMVFYRDWDWLARVGA